MATSPLLKELWSTKKAKNSKLIREASGCQRGRSTFAPVNTASVAVLAAVEGVCGGGLLVWSGT